LTKASLYVYFGPVAVLTCRRFDHTPTSSLSISRITMFDGYETTSTTSAIPMIHYSKTCRWWVNCIWDRYSIKVL